LIHGRGLKCGLLPGSC